jgi:plastocyanin
MSLTRLLAIAAIVTAAACGSSTGANPPPPPPPPPPAPPPPPPPPGATLGVTVGPGQAFSPSSGSVTSGGTVTFTWANGNTTDHNVTFEDGNGTIGNRSSGSGSRTFPTVTSSTVFRYRCTIHSAAFGSGMSGQITVVP